MGKKKSKTKNQPALSSRSAGVSKGAREEQTFAAVTGGNKLSRGLLLNEVGAPGTVDAQTGFTVDPYNPSLSGPDWFKTVDQILKTSAEAAYIRHLWVLPIVGATWSVEGQSEELNQLVRTALFEPDGMSTVWDDVLGNAVLCALYGTWSFEIVYKELDGAITLKRLSDRPPATITGYRYAPDRGLKSILNKGVPPGGTEEVEVEIPIEKMILLPYRRQGHDYNGQSILRPGYRYWYALDMLERIANSGIEHSLFGVPIGMEPAGATDDARSTFLGLLESIRRHETSGLSLPFGWSVADGKQFGGTDSVGCLEWTRWLAIRFLRSCLAEAGALGDSSAGSRDLVDVKVRLLMTCLHGLAAFIAAIFNRHLIGRLIDLNAPTAKGEDIPQLVHSRVGHDLQLDQLSAFLTALIQGNALHPNPDDEKFFRDLLGLPEVDLSKLPAPPTKDQTPASSASGSGSGTPLPAGEVAGPPAGEGSGAPDQPQGFSATLALSSPSAGVSKGLRFGEQTFAAVDRAAALAAVRDDMTSARDEWGRRGSQFAIEMLNDLLDQADRGASDLIVSATLLDRYAGWIGDWMTRLYDTAAEQMRAELGRPVPVTPPGDIATRARLLAEKHAADLGFEVRMSLLNGEAADQVAARFTTAMRRALEEMANTEGSTAADRANAAAASAALG